MQYRTTIEVEINAPNITVAGDIRELIVNQIDRTPGVGWCSYEDELDIIQTGFDFGDAAPLSVAQ